MSQLTAPWSIGVDVGGTFTDLVMRDSEGVINVTKVPSVTADPSRGVMNALVAQSEQAGFSLSDLLGDCELFVHGSTIATNTILERKGARIGMLTTRGFRDSLEIRRGIRENQWDHRAPFPQVLVPRYLRLPVSERIDRHGQETLPLDLQDIEAAVKIFQAERVQAVAICFFNAYLNGAHERAAEKRLLDMMGDTFISMSHQVTPIMGEYERGSTVAMNAYVAPKVVSYLKALDDSLREEGLGRPLLLLQSNGGAISVEEIAKRPVNLLLSGPAAGVGALQLCDAQLDQNNLIAMEIGGTSCDVTLMHQGQVPVSEELNIEGYHLGTPAVDIHTVGAGGGTIAWIDSAGMLCVGPKGAGANPGPACYGLGGTEPTATDAHLVLGRLKPGPYAGGAVTLDLERAEAAIARKIAEPLGINTEAAAIGILQLLEQNVLHAVERISIERGYDPSRFVLVAAGGAGPMHGTSVARALGCRQVYIPRQAGAFCAIGMLYSDVRQDFLKAHLAPFEETSDADVEDLFADLLQRGRDFLDREGFHRHQGALRREIDLRYRGQLWSIRVDAGIEGLDRAAIVRAFEEQHERQFGHIQPDGTLDLTAVRVIANGLVDRAEWPHMTGEATAPEPTDFTDVYLDATQGYQQTPRYAGGDLSAGAELQGPLLVAEETTTILVGSGDHLCVDAYGNYLITLAGIPP